MKMEPLWMSKCMIKAPKIIVIDTIPLFSVHDTHKSNKKYPKKHYIQAVSYLYLIYHDFKGTRTTTLNINPIVPNLEVKTGSNERIQLDSIPFWDACPSG